MYIGLHVQYRYSCHFYIKLELSVHIFEKSSNTKFYENPSSGGRVATCGRTDRHDEANRRFKQFCECHYKLVTVPYQSTYLPTCRENLNLHLTVEVSCSLLESQGNVCSKYSLKWLMVLAQPFTASYPRSFV